jgi:hypothetical protein
MRDRSRKDLIQVIFSESRGQETPREGSLTVQQLVEKDIEGTVAEYRMYGNWYVDCYRPLLPDSVDSIIALVLNCGVPPTAEMNDMRGSSDVQPYELLTSLPRKERRALAPRFQYAPCVMAE